MAIAKNSTPLLELATKARTERAEFPLKDLVPRKDRYCHRDDSALKREALRPMMDSLALEGLNTPLEVVLGAKGKPNIVKGHRRYFGMWYLAEDNHPNFNLDTLVKVDVVLDATEQDLLLRSITDNEVRLNMGPIERCRIMKDLDEAGVPVQRAAAALGVTLKTYQRDRVVVDHPWMFSLIQTGQIVHSTAVQLLEAAVKHDRLEELQKDLLKWIGYTEGKIHERERLRKQKGGKDLRPGETQVKTHMTRDLVDRWLSQLRKKERLAMEVKWDFAAGVDADTNRLTIEGIDIDISKVPLVQLGMVYGKLAALQKGTLEVLKTRAALERPEGPQAAVRESQDDPYALDVLRAEGLGDIADELEIEAMENAEAQEADDENQEENKENQEE